MKLSPLFVGGILVCSIFGRLHAATFYVNGAGANPTPPFADWSTAATNIQDAIDASTNGDVILVTNGLYATGAGRSMDGRSTNRVTIDKAVTVESVSGPFSTIIQGQTVLASGPGSVRCAWLTNGATLQGFTLQYGGALFGTSGGGALCSSTQAIVANCVIVSNTTQANGGGVFQGTVENCFISGNTASALPGGGGAYCCNLLNCTIVNNSSPAVFQQGKAIFSATNCIIAGQIANYAYGNYGYCCATPLPTGAGNFTNNPLLFADSIHLTSSSPCIGAGTNLAVGTDLFGHPWANPPSVGCAEWTPNPVATTPHFFFTAASAFNVAGVALDGMAPFSVFWLKNGDALQDDALYAGTQTTNLAVANLDITNQGSYQIVVSNAFGMATSAPASLNIHCVNASSGNAAAPYRTWDTAAVTIQDAIDAAQPGDLILVTNGLYASGGKTLDGYTSNRVSLDKPITVKSVHGPFVTQIQGSITNSAKSVRCAFLTNNTALIGFTLQFGATSTIGVGADYKNGAGAWCSTNSALVENCVIVSNSAGGYGGGVCQGTVRNSVFIHNAAGGAAGGGMAYSSLINCTLVNNLNNYIYAGAATNCIFSPSLLGTYTTRFSHCCGAPANTGVGDVNGAPELAPDNMHLLYGSPCIGAGANLAAGLDLFGLPWNSQPSIGCAEFSPLPSVTAPSLSLVLSPPGFTIGNAATNGAGPVAVWWLKDGVPLQDDAHFAGAQTATLTASGIAGSDGGAYQLVVSNNYGVVTSVVATLTLHCVDASGTNSVSPYTSWATAATNIQDAIDAAAPGEVVIVTNGVYTGGGKSADDVITNRVTLDKSIILQSANGPFVTAIQGAYDPASTNGPLAVRCAWLTSNAALSGFTLQGGATRAGSALYSSYGGGVLAANSNGLVFNCVFTNDFAEFGGAVAYAAVNNSLLSGNCAFQDGGGAYDATLDQCTVTLNYTTQFPKVAPHGAGTYGCFVKNSIVWDNGEPYPRVIQEDDYGQNLGLQFPDFFEYSCITRDPGEGYPSMYGAGVVSNSPQFLDGVHLAATSPCHGAGNPAFSVGADLDGQPWANPPSMGCFEIVTNGFTGPLAVSILASATNAGISSPSLLYGITFNADVIGHASSLNWTFGDGQGVTNAPAEVTHEWTNAGTYLVTCTVFNLDHPSGVSASMTIGVQRLPQPYFEPPALTNSAVRITFQTLVGANYTVQYTTNLTPPVTWFPLQQFSPVLGGQLQVTDIPPTNQSRFYRILAR